MSLLLDILLALALVVLAFQVAAGRTLFRGIVVFVVFGVVMALAWARLGAPDLALAEAAIGAGMTGALLMVGYRRLFTRAPEKMRRAHKRDTRLAAPLAVLVSALVAVLGWSALELPTGAGSAGQGVLDAMPAQPVGNPVTAVLLVFRGYDTLLELVVLMVALLGVRAIQGGEGPPPLPTPAHAGLPLVGALLSALVPLAVLVAGYLLHAGGHAPGGAFQAGAVLAAAGVLLLLTGRLQPHARPDAFDRIGLVLGVAVFSGIGLSMLALAGQLLAMPGAWAIYLVETAMMLSIGLTLVLLFGAAAGVRLRGPE